MKTQMTKMSFKDFKHYRLKIKTKTKSKMPAKINTAI